MFGFGKKKEPEKPRPERKGHNRTQLDFLAGSFDNDKDPSPDGDEADLEDELLMLLNEGPLKPSNNVKSSGNDKTTAPGIPSNNKTLNDIMQMYPDADDDNEGDLDDEDINDPDLEAELLGLGEYYSEETTPEEEQLPQQQLPVKSPIKPVLKEIPSQVALEKPLVPLPPQHDSLLLSMSSLSINPPKAEAVQEYVKSDIDPKLVERLNQYKSMALTLKKVGDMEGAKEYFRLFKVLDSVRISGGVVNWNDFPPPPEAAGESTIRNVSDNASATQSPGIQPTAGTSAVATSNETATESNDKGSENIYGAIPIPTSILDALQQRLAKYESEAEKAAATGNSSKARRMGRIVKQYKDAIISHKKGGQVAFEDLPTPPGYPPIPVSAPTAANSTVAEPGPSRIPARTDNLSPEKRGGPSIAKPSGSSSLQPQSSIQRAGKQVSKLTLQEKQLSLILLRQKQFKEAALDAKKRGDTVQALEFLRTAKGFEKLIQVSQAGLPVDMSSLPGAPDAVAALEDVTSEIFSAADCIQIEGSSAEVFAKLQQDLKSQMKLSMSLSNHSKSIGEVASANRFQSYALETKRDLDKLILAARSGTGLPKYHYETRIFSVTECNSDLNDDEIEICVVRGINLTVPSPTDFVTFVRVELSYPSVEEAQSQKSGVVKDTNNPSYNVICKMNINRKARNFPRFVRRHGAKIEVWSKGGFFKTKALIGTAVVKLVPLETKCTLHDAFDVLDGRKIVGKLEVKIRLRDPVSTKHITQQKQQWLYIDI